MIERDEIAEAVKTRLGKALDVPEAQNDGLDYRIHDREAEQHQDRQQQQVGGRGIGNPLTKRGEPPLTSPRLGGLGSSSRAN